MHGLGDREQGAAPRRRRRSLALVAAAALVLSACGDSNGSETSGGAGTGGTNEGGSGPSEVTVQIDGQTDDFNSAFFAYFPDTVTVHPGDTVVYESVFTGEPHSITFGTLVTDAVDAFRSLTPEQLEAEGPPPAEVAAAFEALPGMLPEGPGDANQISVNPCFVASGDLPEDGTQQCEVTEPAPFTGTETFYNSGFLPDGETFELQLADDIEPGTYVGFCMLHFTEMISEIVVVPEDQEIPSADQVADLGQQQLDALAAQLAPLAEAPDDADPGEVAAGVGSEEIRGAMVAGFVPQDVEVAAGEQVSWSFFGPHTVSFNAPEEARTLLSKGDDGGYHLNGEALAPAGFDAPAPPEGGEGEGGEGEGGEGEGGEGEGGEGEGSPPPLDAGTWDGTGFLSSGIAFGGEFTMTFSEPGTYEYVCLIHPEMEGTVKVS
jgi:plastocyanin